MLEIVLVIALCKVLGNLLRAKGRKPIWFQVMLVLGWILGEFAGAFVGGVVHAIRNGEAPMGIGVYLFAIMGAAVGAGCTFLIAYLLPALNRESRLENLTYEPLERRIDPNNPYAP